MRVPSKSSILISLLALSMTLATAAAVRADTRASLQINFGSKPHWVGVPGTSVRVIRQSDRTDYDMFRYGNRYYAYNSADSRWYSSRGYRGQFVMIDDRSVPRDLRRVPRNHWRNYPSSWDRNDGRRDRGYGSRGYQGRGYQDRGDYQTSGGSAATLQVRFGSTPHWTGVSGTRVEVVPMGERPEYDVFRYGGTYYVYNSDHWYTSTRQDGQFTMISDQDVPTEFSRVPRQEWRHYPSTWDGRDNNGQGRYDNRDRGGN